MKSHIKNKYPVIWKHKYYKYDNVTSLKMPPLEVLNFLFKYEPETGKLYRIRDAIGRPYDMLEMCNKTKEGYLRVDIVDSYGKRAEFQVHRIIWFMHYHTEPNKLVDHIDWNKTNNKIENLRLVDNATNLRNRRISINNKSGMAGIRFNENCNRWEANVGINNKHIILGTYRKKDEAIIARLAAIQIANSFLGENGFTESHIYGK